MSDDGETVAPIVELLRCALDHADRLDDTLLAAKVDDALHCAIQRATPREAFAEDSQSG